MEQTRSKLLYSFPLVWAGPPLAVTGSLITETRGKKRYWYKGSIRHIILFSCIRAEIGPWKALLSPKGRSWTTLSTVLPHAYLSYYKRVSLPIIIPAPISVHLSLRIEVLHPLTWSALFPESDRHRQKWRNPTFHLGMRALLDVLIDRFGTLLFSLELACCRLIHCWWFS